MPPPCPGSAASGVGDRTAEEFGAGGANPGVHLARTGDGPELILAPAVAAEFGAGLPADWFTEPWKEGGTVEQDGTGLVLEGATVGYSPLCGSGRSLEFVATFRKRPHQHVGFGTNFRTVPWVTFSTKFGNSLYARTNFIIPEDTRLPATLLGAPHRFRIDWRVIDVAFWVDGRRVAHQLVPVVGYMRPLASNGSIGGGALNVEWMRMSPYAPEGDFTSRVHDAGGPARWEGCDVDATVPAGTAVTMEVRAGDTPEPDEGWTAWVGAGAVGTGSVGTGAGGEGDVPVAVPGRFAQYRARLTTESSTDTPVVRGVTLRYSSSGWG